MSKNFKRILLGGAAMAVGAAAGIAYYVKKKEKKDSWNEDLEDFEDGLNGEDSAEPDGAQEKKREYVTLHVDHKAEEAAAEPESSAAEPAGEADAPEETAEPAGEAAVPDESDDSPLDEPEDLDPEADESAPAAEASESADEAEEAEKE